jgi:DNA-binding NarL/FixJ family response regulator
MPAARLARRRDDAVEARTSVVACNMATQVLLVDDHPLFRAGLRVLLERGSVLAVAVVGEAATTSAAIELATATAFDAAIIDVVVPEAGGPSLVRTLRELRPACRILALSMLGDPIRVAQMLLAGASGYALKSDPPESIVAGLHAVLRGARYLSPAIAVADVERLLAAKRLPLDSLTARERDVFDLLVRGNTNAHIAEHLAIAQSTVETHRRHIMTKLAAASVIDLVHLAVSHGALVGPPSEPDHIDEGR